jgi:hypothetical protein
MIHSSIGDNWFRLETIHGIARNLYEATAHSDHRDRQLNGGYPFPFSGEVFDSIQLKKSIVGMVITWSAITLEAILNHTLAEKLNSRLAATQAIENPAKFLHDFKIKLPRGGRQSELARKAIILSDCLEPAPSIIDDTNVIADRRNQIIHDKPFYFYKRDEEDFEQWSYSTRTNDEKKHHSYDVLIEHYERCDRVLTYIEKFHCIENEQDPPRRFSALQESTPSA